MPRTKNIPPDHDRCLHYDSIGRRCTRLRLPSDETFQHTLCFYHYNRNAQSSQPSPAIPLSARPDVVAFRLLPADATLRTAEAVNLLLTRVFREVAEGHLSPKQASTLAYLGQLILSTVPHLQREAATVATHPILSTSPEATLDALTRALQSMLVPDSPQTTTNLASHDSADSSSDSCDASVAHGAH